MSIRNDMAVLAWHEGEWEGAYVHVDANGKEVDRHASRLSCQFPSEDDGCDYFQINECMSEDGQSKRFAI